MKTRHYVGNTAAGAETWLEIEHLNNGKMRMQAWDIQPDPVVRQMLDANTNARNSEHNDRAAGALTHNIPIALWQQWRWEWMQKAKPYGISWNEFKLKRLNSREYCQLRTHSRYQKL